MFKWLRLLVYRSMPPLSPDTAMLYKQKLAVIYAATGWILFGLTIYNFASSSLPKIHDRVDYGALLKLNESTTVIKYSGLKKVEESKFTKDEGIENNDKTPEDKNSKNMKEIV